MANITGEAAALPAPPLNLREVRIRTGRSLEEIAERTKISIRFLRAIEAEDFGQLPGGIFDISYLKQYAAEIAIAPDPLLELYRTRVGESDGQKAQQGRKATRPLPWRWLRFLSPERC